MRFEKYEVPGSISECCQMLRYYGPDGKVLAGGTDLVPRLRSGEYRLKAVLDISHLAELAALQEENGGWFLGSMRRLRALQMQTIADAPYAIVAECAGHVSSMQVRNMATLGGNVCNASPCADTVPGLLMMDASCRIQGVGGVRTVALSDFLLAPGKTALQQGELLEGFELPAPPVGAAGAYEKFAIRGDSDISLVGAGAMLALDEAGKISHARIALASVGPTALRMHGAEQLLVGQTPCEELFVQAAQLCSQDCAPITDQRASEDYRRQMVAVFTEKALQRAAQKAANR